MPRFLIEIRPLVPAGPGSAQRLTWQSFPEVVVEERFLAYDDTSSREVWLCRAPSAAHIHRWALATSLVLVALQHVADVPSGDPEQPGTDHCSSGPNEPAREESR